VITTFGLYALFGIEFNLTSIAAILTIAGHRSTTPGGVRPAAENLRKQASVARQLSTSPSTKRCRHPPSLGMIMLIRWLPPFGGRDLRLQRRWAARSSSAPSDIYVAASLLLYLPLVPDRDMPARPGEARPGAGADQRPAAAPPMKAGDL
jgi:hypothetical protein